MNIFKQNEFLLDEILDQVMYISSVDNYESFIFVFVIYKVLFHIDIIFSLLLQLSII